jgi:hypothetical protein
VAKWLQELDFHFRIGWIEHADPEHIVPNPLYAGVTRLLPNVEAELTHPVELPGGALRFVIVDTSGAANVVLFEPPSATTLWHVRSLAGGQYRETVTTGETAVDEIAGEFSHPRLAEPFRIVLRVPQRLASLSAMEEEVLLRAEKFRDQLIRWSVTPPAQT